MAATTVTRDTKRKPGERISYQMGAVLIPKGVLVFARIADGFAYNGRAVASITDVFLGVSYEGKDNSAGTGGALSLLVDKAGSHSFALASAVQANVGQPVYALDNQTLTLTSASTNILVGYIQSIIDTGNVYVRINRAVN